MEGFWCGKQALVRSVDLKVLCNVTLRTVSGWEHSSTKQLERVPRGSFGGATCKYTVSVSIIDRSRAVLKKQMRQVLRLSLFLKNNATGQFTCRFLFVIIKLVEFEDFMLQK